MKYKFGFRIPQHSKEALELNKDSNNNLWAQAICNELNQTHEYKTFKNLGKGVSPPTGYKRICVHFVFDVKHDGCHKARLVADGHLTDEPEDTIYSSIVSLQSLRLVVVVAE